MSSCVAMRVGYSLQMYLGHEAHKTDVQHWAEKSGDARGYYKEVENEYEGSFVLSTNVFSDQTLIDTIGVKLIKTILLLFIGITLQAQDFSAYQKKTFQTHKGALPYRVLYPAPFDTNKTYPLLIFLHGAFEKGTDNEAQLSIGGRYFLREENRKNFPAIILFPQCPEDDAWAWFDTRIDSATGLAASWDFPFRKEPTTVTSLLKGLLDSLMSIQFIDKSRIYIGGLSQGGMGVYDMVARYPDIFAAAFPICGAGKVSTSKAFAAKVSLWIFHGSDDEIVPPYFSRDFYKRLSKLNADVKYSEYPGVHHNSWINAFGEKELLSWLFSKAKKQ